MRQDIVMGGFGGQGVKIIATLLGQAANAAGLHSAMYNIYGAAIRGGAIFCYSAVSDQPITDAVVTTFPSAVLAMDANSMHTFEKVIQPGGTLVVNTSLIDFKATRNDISVVYVPTSEIANELGDFKLCGMVALGALVAKTGVVSMDAVSSSLERTIPASRHGLLGANRLALQRGAELASAVQSLAA